MKKGGGAWDIRSLLKEMLERGHLSGWAGTLPNTRPEYQKGGGEGGKKRMGNTPGHSDFRKGSHEGWGRPQSIIPPMVVTAYIMVLTRFFQRKKVRMMKGGPESAGNRW